MACAAPTVSSTKETTNYARLCRLLVDTGTQALRDTFNPPANLQSVLAANKATIQSLRKRGLSTQRNGESSILLFHPQCLPETLISHF